jgi:hypothetical protein
VVDVDGVDEPQRDDVPPEVRVRDVPDPVADGVGVG